ncbi:aminotransferase class III-fold pyridoxal phosphate-dependent enzyme [Actinomadura graeca]|uniref:Aminotransferase class III-fold pyridoxal phosphate-dependent enzyme n=1 Tax=Actinomadura graeca TaxID=2750812 RepID=A0ABX8QTY7_9ACTN|nr:aminotransferase class III-fold pyridoxal phosphate-dependent enzyme [Actinomadura graeca]QXJ21429.1 aminotransferase class III-fold pyridoxal phosphate-dependent enzyme [Actinomadura graeca]
MVAVSGSTVFRTVRRHMSPGLAAVYRDAGHGSHEETAAGATVRLADGREVVDFGSYGVTLLGHGCPPVAAAVAAQLRTMPAATRSLANPAVAEFVRRLTERCEPDLGRVWIGSDGADAVEVATKLAMRVTGRTRLLAVEGGFHGKTLGALALTHAAVYHEGLEPLLRHVAHLPEDDPEAVAREAAAGDVAALVVEPIRGEGGVRPLAPEIAERWAADARSAGAFVISDEIQVGLRRCGDFCLATARGWNPDAVLFGKALGGGIMPISVMVATSELFQPLAENPGYHSSTFGGHPLACAAATAALTAIEEFAERAREVGAAVEAGLRTLRSGHPGIVADVRGTGLLWGVDVRGGAAGPVIADLAAAGLLVSPCLGSPGTIRLLPPMVATDAEIGRALEILDATFALQAAVPAAARPAGRC